MNITSQLSLTLPNDIWHSIIENLTYKALFKLKIISKNFGVLYESQIIYLLRRILYNPRNAIKINVDNYNLKQLYHMCKIQDNKILISAGSNHSLIYNEKLYYLGPKDYLNGNRNGKISYHCYEQFNNLKIISSGYEYSLILDNDDNLFLINGNVIKKLQDYPKDIIKLQVGKFGSPVLTQNGKMYDIGIMDSGGYPGIKIENLSKVIDIHENEHSVLALTEDNDIYVLYSTGPGFTKPKILGTVDGAISVTHNDTSILILTKRGTVYKVNRRDIYDVNNIRCTNLNVDNIVQISTGKNHSLLLNNNGEVYGLGNNSRGQLCLLSVMTSIPKLMCNLPSNIISIAAGDNFSLILRDNGELYGFGYNNEGQLGHTDIQSIRTATRIL